MTRTRTWAGLLVAVLAAALLWWQQGDGAVTTEDPPATPSASSSPTDSPPPLPTPTATEAATAADDGVDPESGLPVVTQAELPPQAVDTLRLIDAGGPYPYDRDDIVFENRERLLPDRPLGYYREYTVETPGVDGRGARRIVAGSQGELYWTDDHYTTFARITRSSG